MSVYLCLICHGFSENDSMISLSEKSRIVNIEGVIFAASLKCIFKEVASMSQSPNDVARPYLIALIDHTSSSNKGTRFHKIEILNIDSTKFSENVPCE